MRCIRLASVLLAALLLQSAAIDAISGLGPAGQQSRRQKVTGNITDRLQSRVAAVPERLRQDAQALISASDLNTKRELIEKLGDSSSDGVVDLFADLLVNERVASVRLDLLEYLNRNTRPKLRPVFETLAKNDPDPEVAIMALEGVRSVDVLKLRDILKQRLAQSGKSGPAFDTFAEADERWISLVRGSMLPAFLRVTPPTFSAKQQDTIRVVVFGDFGTGTDEQRAVAAAMMSRHRQSPYDIGITTGDNFYTVGMESPTDPRWKDWWSKMYDPLQITIYPSLGNHDWYHFDSPAAEILFESPSWRLTSPYYSFTAGPIQFFALDTQEVSLKQLRWLDEELKKSQSRWKVVYGHHPIYSDGYHGDNSRLIDQLLPLLKNRVDVYVSGHEHDLQHLKPDGGVHFLVSGGGGRELRTPQPTSRSFFAEEAHGFTILDATQATLRMEFVGTDSKTIHEYTLRK